MYQGLQTSKSSNQTKTVLLLLLFPLLLGGAIFLLYYFDAWGTDALAYAQAKTLQVMTWLIPVLWIRMLISFFFQRELMFSFSGARVVTRVDEPEIYNIVENLCITKGLSVPKIWIIEERWMNAFALWWRSSDSWIVFTRGLLNTLNRQEIEAVAAHELTHILNKDSLLMMVIVLYIWAVSLVGEFLLRFGSVKSSDENKKGNPLVLIGFFLVLLGYIVYPLIRLAVSRRREFLADAWAVELTRDRQAMISALEKISQKSEIPLDNHEMAAMFIVNPLEKISYLLKTHPSIEERIKALECY